MRQAQVDSPFCDWVFNLESAFGFAKFFFDQRVIADAEKVAEFIFIGTKNRIAFVSEIDCFFKITIGCKRIQSRKKDHGNPGNCLFHKLELKINKLFLAVNTQYITKEKNQQQLRIKGEIGICKNLVVIFFLQA